MYALSTDTKLSIHVSRWDLSITFRYVYLNWRKIAQKLVLVGAPCKIILWVGGAFIMAAIYEAMIGCRAWIDNGIDIELIAWN